MIIQADARRIPLRDGSVQTVVTSPPYWGLRRYEGVPESAWGGDPNHEHRWGPQQRGRRSDLLPSEASSSEARKGTDERQEGASQDGGRFCVCGAWLGCLGLEPDPFLFIDHLVGIFREVRRVLRDDGTLWVNMGDSFAGGGRGPDVNSTLQGSRVSQEESRRALAAAGGRCVPDGVKRKDLVGVPWMLALALRADGWWLRRDIIWAKGVSFCDTYAGSAMPENVTDRPASTHEYLFLLSKSARYFYDHEAVKERAIMKPQRRPGGRPLDETPRPGQPRQAWSTAARDDVGQDAPGGMRNLRSVWAISPRGYDGAHFAVFPEAIVEPCVKAGTSSKGACATCGAPWTRLTSKRFRDRDDAGRTKHGKDDRMGKSPPPERGWETETETETVGWSPSCVHPGEPVPCVVLDPFSGSGTTVRVAKRFGRRGVGLDRSMTYLTDCAKDRAGANIQVEMFR